MESSLGTTNLWLGIIAAVSVLEAVVLAGVAFMAYRVYSQAMSTIQQIEARRIAPLVERINAILSDVKGVTSRVSAQAERVDHAVQDTIDRVDHTADRVVANVRDKANLVVACARGVRTALETLLSGGHRHPPAHASGEA